MASSNFVRTGLNAGFAAVLLVTSIDCLARADDIVGRPPASGQTDLTIGEGAFRHLQALQDIATANGGNRAAGTVGYDRSAEYVAERLKEAGYTVRFEEFEFPFFEEKSPPVLLTIKPDGSQESAPNSRFSHLVRLRLERCGGSPACGESPADRRIAGGLSERMRGDDFDDFERGCRGAGATRDMPVPSQGRQRGRGRRRWRRYHE